MTILDDIKYPDGDLTRYYDSYWDGRYMLIGQRKSLRGYKITFIKPGWVADVACGLQFVDPCCRVL
jgi:hypothetical protein